MPTNPRLVLKPHRNKKVKKLPTENFRSDALRSMFQVKINSIDFQF